MVGGVVGGVAGVLTVVLVAVTLVLAVVVSRRYFQERMNVHVSGTHVLATNYVYCNCGLPEKVEQLVYNYNVPTLHGRWYWVWWTE